MRLTEEQRAAAQATRAARAAERKAAGVPTLRQAIDAMCRDCIYDPLSGGGHWRQQVQACRITACPLWKVRPVSKPRPSHE